MNDLDAALAALRLERLAETEKDYWYAGCQLLDGFPIGPQIEAAALSRLLQQRPLAKCTSEERAHIQQLCDSYTNRTSLEALQQAPTSPLAPTAMLVPASAKTSSEGAQAHTGASAAAVTGQAFDPESPEARLAKWATQQGIITCLQPAVFPVQPAGTSTDIQAASDSNQEPAGSGAQSSQHSCSATASACHTSAAGAAVGASGTAATAPDTSPAAAAVEAGAAGGTHHASAAVGVVRGVMAGSAVTPGHTLMSVPQSCLITYQTALESDLGGALRRIPGLDDESAAVIWTMLDHCDAESPWAPFWAALPRRFGTAVGVKSSVLRQCLAQCPMLLQEALQARQHLRQQFNALAPVFKTLLAAFPQYIQPSQLTWQAYLWAVQLWYAYAIQVQFPDGSIKPCLVPLLSLLNHSCQPHSVTFSRLDPKTRRLNIKSFRNLASGQQAYLSYGPLPNSRLLLFYGFCIPNNPYDEVLLTLPTKQEEASDSAAGSLQADSASTLRSELHQQCGLPTTFPVRGFGGLPVKLLAAARLQAATAGELEQLRGSCQPSVDAKAANSKKKGRGKGTAIAGKDEGVAERLLQRLQQQPLSGRNEQAALQLIQHSIKQAGAELQVTGSFKGQVLQSAAMQEGSKAQEASEGQGAAKRQGALQGEGAVEWQVDMDGEQDDDGSAAAAFKQAALVYLAGQMCVLQYAQGLVQSLLRSQLAK